MRAWVGLSTHCYASATLPISVPQEPVLFSGTVLDNLRYGRIEASRDEACHAATTANAHDFVCAFDDGYDTVVGERGIALSGGQKQRIAIARALLVDPTVWQILPSTPCSYTSPPLGTPASILRAPIVLCPGPTT